MNPLILASVALLFQCFIFVVAAGNSVLEGNRGQAVTCLLIAALNAVAFMATWWAPHG